MLLKYLLLSLNTDIYELIKVQYVRLIVKQLAVKMSYDVFDIIRAYENQGDYCDVCSLGNAYRSIIYHNKYISYISILASKSSDNYCRECWYSIYGMIPCIAVIKK